MDHLTAIAASGMRSRTESLELVANNLANTSTAGYKADGESYNLYFGDNAWDGYLESRPASSEMPIVERNWSDFSQGTLLDTGNLNDIALATPGFFVAQTSSGPLYTRGGHFRTSKQGILETREGYPVLATGGQPVRLDPSKPFVISESGQISQDGSSVAALQIIDADRADALTKRGGTYFMLSPSAKTVAVQDPQVLQGKVESSNVESSYAAVKLVGVLRQFEMMQRAVRIAGDMGKQSVEQVAKVNS
ncbi:MAG TPA: flagellar hook basal-body protein [Bryobacteraceae bacterium]|jgi:flagellar basal body rod protein FlgG|nr:flagellar hook basal-body protein [Bryobacteraceae bacterium]